MVDVTFVGSGDAFGTGGRFQTCILLDAPGCRAAVDFGVPLITNLQIAQRLSEALVEAPVEDLQVRSWSSY